MMVTEITSSWRVCHRTRNGTDKLLVYFDDIGKADKVYLLKGYGHADGTWVRHGGPPWTGYLSGHMAACGFVIGKEINMAHGREFLYRI